MKEFKVGDKVRCIDNNNATLGLLKLNQVYEITGIEADLWGLLIFLDGDNSRWWRSHRFALVSEESTKFNLGDKVSAFGLEGFVCDIENENRIQVEFVLENGDKKYKFFDLDGKLEDWNKNPSLTLIEKCNIPKADYYIYDNGETPMMVYHTLEEVSNDGFDIRKLIPVWKDKK